MASVSAIRDGLQARLQAAIADLRVYDTVLGDVLPPAAVIVPAGGAYDRTYARGSDDIVLEIRLGVSRAVERSAQDLLDEYIAGSGERSIKAAVEADQTLGGVCHFAQVAGWEGYGDVDVGGVTMFGTTLTVEVTASGTA